MINHRQRGHGTSTTDQMSQFEDITSKVERDFPKFSLKDCIPSPERL